MGNVLGSLLGPALLSIGACAEPATASDSKTDKSVFNLFNPTPTEFLRPMDMDGPGSTESPYTVDAGHFQVELTLVDYTYDRDSFDGGTREFEAWAIAPMLLKLGLLNQLDVQLLLEPYNVLYERENGARVTRRGYGDTTLRLKYNLWGNDGGRTALAATPYVRFPTSQDGIGEQGVDGGLVLPLSIELPRDFYLAVTTRFDAVRNEGGSGMHAEFINSIEFGHELFSKLYGYIEFFSGVSTEHGSGWESSFDTGLIYELTESVWFKAGVNIGLTTAADDLIAFAGVAWRF